MPQNIGKNIDFHKRFKFKVEVDGFTKSAFQKCSELSVEIAKVEQWEGGSLVAHKSPGRLTYADVTLERGATSDEDMFTWFKEVADASNNSGLIDGAYKRGIDIIQEDRDGSTLRRWRLEGAWPSKFVAGDWDGTADENVIESITLTFDFFDLSKTQ